MRRFVRAKISGYSKLARLSHVSPAPLTQIMMFLHLAPAIQEYILFLSAADVRFITELELRTRANRAGIDNANCSSGFFIIDLHLRRDRGMNVITRRLPPKGNRQK
jgi:hypothetical protein